MVRLERLSVAETSIRANYNSHVALPFAANTKEVEYIAFDGMGPQRFKMAADEFEQEFSRELVIPLESVALSFLRASQSAYLPGDGVLKLILEIYIMAITTADELKDKKVSEIVAVYNELATAAGKPTVKEFKSKLVGLNRVQQLLDLAAADTPAQAKTRADKKEKAKAAFSKLEKPEPKSKKPAASKAAKQKPAAKPKGKAAKAGAASADKKPRGQGIGAFAMDCILKGKNNEDTLAAVLAKFPDASTSASSVAWYRNKLKSDGKLQ